MKLRWWHYEYYKKTWQEKSNDINKDHKQLTEWVTRVIQRYRVALVFRLLMWPTKIIVGDPILFCWTNLVEIFPVVLVVSWSKFQCVSEIFSFFLSSLVILQFERGISETCDSQIINIIYNSLNCIIFLNIFYSMLFY